MDLNSAKKVFGITNLTDGESLHARYRELIKTNHVDHGGTEGAMKNIIDAYHILKDNLSSNIKNECTSIIPYEGGSITAYKPTGGALSKIKAGLPATIGSGVSAIGGIVGTTIGELIVAPVGSLIAGTVYSSAAHIAAEAQSIKEQVDKKIEQERERKEYIEELKEEYDFDPNNMYSILFALSETEDVTILKLINPKFYKDDEFMRLAIEIVPESIMFADSSLTSSADFMLTVLTSYEETLYFADKSLKSNDEFVMKALEICPYGVLKYCHPKYRNKDEVILKAIEIDGLCLEFANKKYWYDSKVIATAIKSNLATLNLFTKNDIKEFGIGKIKEFVLGCIILEKEEFIPLCSQEYLNDVSIALDCVKQNGLALRFFLNTPQNDFEVCKAAIVQNINAISYVSNKQLDNSELAKIAVGIDGLLLEKFHMNVRNDEEVVDIALINNIESFKFASPTFSFNDKWICKIVKKLGTGTNEALRDEKRYLVIAIEEFGFDAWRKSDSKYKLDSDVLYAVMCVAKDGETEIIINECYKANPNRQQKVSCPYCGGHFMDECPDEIGDYEEYCPNCGSRPTAHYPYSKHDKGIKYLINISPQAAIEYFLHFNVPIEKYMEIDGKVIKAIVDRTIKTKHLELEHVKYVNNENILENLIYLCEEPEILSKMDYNPTLAKRVIEKYGIDILKCIGKCYTSNKNFICELCQKYGIKVFDYATLNPKDIAEIKEKLLANGNDDVIRELKLFEYEKQRQDLERQKTELLNESNKKQDESSFQK